jgi:hypothetical protein
MFSLFTNPITRLDSNASNKTLQKIKATPSDTSYRVLLWFPANANTLDNSLDLDVHKDVGQIAIIAYEYILLQFALLPLQDVSPYVSLFSLLVTLHDILTVGHYFYPQSTYFPRD